MWTYKCHDVVAKIMWYPYRALRCISYVSWHYAHYVNGKGPRGAKENLFGVIKDQWWSSHPDRD